MVGHERTDHGTALPARHPGGRIVDGFIEAVLAFESFGSQALEIETCLLGSHHQSHRGGVGGHNQVFRQSAFQSHAGYAECPVLVVQPGVGNVVGRFGDAPWHSSLCAVFDLPLHGREVGLIEQRVLVSGHHQQRHQVLKHRAAPGHQDRAGFGTG